VAEDIGMTRIIRQGATLATRSNGHAVRVMVGGLPSNRWLYYRFHALGESSRVGRTRTFPVLGELVDNLRFAVVSCQNYTDGFFPAYRDILTQELDFVVHTGDYIYENGPVAVPIAPNRNHNSAEIFSVNDYRNRYALYRLDRNLQEAHAQLPFLVTWDDHEVDNDYAGFNAESSAPFQGEDFRIRRRNAYQVYSETMPLRLANTLRGAMETMRLFRKLSFGHLADIYMLDTRQFRSQQPADGGFGSTSPTSAALEPVLGEVLFDDAGINNAGATLAGRFQENWLRSNLQRSSATWNVLAQQVMVMPWNLKNTARLVTAAALQQQNAPAEQQAQILAAFDNIGDILNVDAWDGYPAARQRLFAIIRESGARNPVVLTGDIHSAWGAELLSDFSDPQSQLIAAEFVCTSIASDFAGLDPKAD
jgi:alkaline phosphatase D